MRHFSGHKIPNKTSRGCGQRATYIQPVFDRRVQHGEVCEEDSQVGHCALGAGLYKKTDQKKNIERTIKVSYVPQSFFYSHDGKEPHTEPDFRAAACGYFSNEDL